MFTHIFCATYLQCCLYKSLCHSLSKHQNYFHLCCITTPNVSVLPAHTHMHAHTPKHTYADQIVNDLYPYLTCRVYSLYPPPTVLIFMNMDQLLLPHNGTPRILIYCCTSSISFTVWSVKEKIHRSDNNYGLWSVRWWIVNLPPPR